MTNAPLPGSQQTLIRPLTWMELLVRRSGTAERLRAKVGEARADVAALDPTKPPGDECRLLLDAAQAACDARFLGWPLPRHAVAWECLLRIDRLLVATWSQQRVLVHWHSIKAEALEKLTGHRRTAVQTIVDQVKLIPASPASAADTGPRLRFTEQPTVDQVEEVLRHVHTASQNQFLRMEHLRQQIVVAVILLVALITVIFLHYQGTDLTAAEIEELYRSTFPPATEGGIPTAIGPTSTPVVDAGQLSVLTPRPGLMVAYGMLAGFLGGVLSLAYTAMRMDLSVKIPALRAGFMTALLRPFVGCAVALPVILLYESGMIALTESPENGPQARSMLLLSCLIAGFSERWFLGVMRRFDRP